MVRDWRISDEEVEQLLAIAEQMRKNNESLILLKEKIDKSNNLHYFLIFVMGSIGGFVGWFIAKTIFG